MVDQIINAINVLKQGRIVIFPTDTAFGIGCRMDDEKAVERLFEIRRRPVTQATPELVSSIEMAQEYLLPIDSEVIEKLMKPYWPGGLTIVLPCRINKVSELVRGGTNTLGVRMPNHKIALEIIKGVGVPILGPSANFHGEKTPFEFGDLDKELIRKVDYVVHGECSLKQPARLASRASEGVAGMASTVIDCSVKPWKVLREGAVKLEL